jgi:hypothetical protein
MRSALLLILSLATPDAGSTQDDYPVLPACSSKDEKVMRQEIQRLRATLVYYRARCGDRCRQGSN